MLKYLIRILLIILLASCSSTGGKDHLRSKEITLQIVNTQEKNQHFLLTVITDGKETNQAAAKFPKSFIIITNENKKAKVKLNLRTKYTIKVAKTPVKNIDELQNKKKSGQKVAGRLLANVEFTPTKHSDTLKIKINNDNHKKVPELPNSE
ncbi:hypothetical protein [Fictibacillus sp. KU28468]|uniref:hypothetical protein n=1 Tax=Fictibacillus sp. KU28468 TaxID=2991053 RepID=UPI00223E548D|nr:hypothetical protein [Fictibacillus sp. KU28468]UZJ79611.1 hypothetical protein OKX00_03775 [Fictibacillus sp. KU28468]